MDEINENRDSVKIGIPPFPEPQTHEGVPKKISRSRTNRESRQREERWFASNLAPLQDLIKAGALRSENFVLYGLWWQIERWIKDLIRLEMMAAYGMDWVARVPSVEDRRMKQAPENAYMRSSDDGNPVAYCDLGDIDDITSEEWSLLGYALLSQPRWKGRLSELKPVRHRIGHCRQPHADDLARVQQTLRDLTPGARLALSCYAEGRWLSPGDGDLYEKWHRGPDAGDGILRHLATHYDIACRVKISKRPWSAEDALLHLHWRSRKWPLDLAKIDGFLEMMTDAECGPLIHLNVPGPHMAEAVFALRDRPAAEAAVDLWVGEIATLHTPFAASDLFDWPERRSEDHRVRLDDYFAHAADAARGDPFAIVAK